MPDTSPTSIDIIRERNRTQPDYVVFTPTSIDGSSADTGNEHFFVFDSPDGNPGSLLAVWSQSTQEHEKDHRAVIARSSDHGQTWSAPQIIAGADGTKSSWAFPVVTTSGRLYVFYQRKTDLSLGPDRSPLGFACKYSDDYGRTWSEEGIIPVPRTQWDSPDPEKNASWLVWQKPERLSEGKPFIGVTRHVSEVLPNKPVNHWVAAASVVDFVRFENIDENPPIEHIKLRFMCSGDNALQVGLVDYPDHPVAQEPSIVPLPDGRLFCVMRTLTGSPYYSISKNEGLTWSEPEVLRYRDGGAPLLNPLSPCPIYRTVQGDYFMFIHNHDKWLPISDNELRRNPLYLVRGEYRPDAHQPVWFSEPHLFMDTGNVPLGYENRVNGLAMYDSVTYHGDRTVLWYPDRKFYLLGREIKRDMMDALTVPE